MKKKMGRVQSQSSSQCHTEQFSLEKLDGQLDIDSGRPVSWHLRDGGRFGFVQTANCWEASMRTKIAALLILSMFSPAMARGPYGSVSTAGWTGGAFTDDNTGEFSNCIATANYKSGITFGVLVSKTLNWVLAFTHQSWTL